MELFRYYENYSKLHLGQMGGQNERLAIDEVVILVYTVQEKWENKKLAVALFMDLKKVFDYILKE